MKEAFVVAVVIAALVGLGWVLTANNLAMTSTFAPKYEQVRNDTFKHSQAYQDGVCNDIQNLRVQYASASEDGKNIIADAVVEKTAPYTGPMSSDLKAFVAECKNRKGM